jgi:hypothetical protein
MVSEVSKQIDVIIFVIYAANARKKKNFPNLFFSN